MSHDFILFFHESFLAQFLYLTSATAIILIESALPSGHCLVPSVQVIFPLQFGLGYWGLIISELQKFEEKIEAGADKLLFE